MNYKIIASDLDGTLLNKQGKISPKNWDAIRQLYDMGIHFVPASGRAFYEMPAQLRESPLIRYYITSDGTMVYDKHTDTTWELPMPKPLGHWVLDRLYEYPMCMMLHADTHSYVDAALHADAIYERFNMSRRWIDFIHETNVVTPDFKAFAYGLDTVQMVCPFFRNQEDLRSCMRTLQSDPHLLVAQSDDYNLEVFSAEAGKGNALKLLARQLGVEENATIAVGDSTNDTTMIRAAGLGLAMDNAVPELKEIADTVICNNDAHAISYILEHYVSEE